MPDTSVKSPVIAYGEEIHIGKEDVKITGLTLLQNPLTVKSGYTEKEEYSDKDGNHGVTIFGKFAKTISFSAFLAKGAEPPYGGMKVEIEGFDTAYLDNDLSIAYTDKGASVTGTIIAFKKLPTE